MYVYKRGWGKTTFRHSSLFTDSLADGRCFGMFDIAGVHRNQFINVVFIECVFWICPVGGSMSVWAVIIDLKHEEGEEEDGNRRRTYRPLSMNTCI